MNYILQEDCIVCGTQANGKVFKIADHLVSQEVFDLIECPSCHLRYIKNPPDEPSAAKYYETEEYVEHSDSSKGIINNLYHKAREWMLRYKFRMLDRLGTRRKILDVGTGTGYFLKYMRSRGYECNGIEISEKARNFGRHRFLLDIREPSAMYLKDFPGDFGIISFWHVFEHVYNPTAVLSRLRELLAQDGRLVIALPNYNCLEARYYGKWWNGYDIPRHLWHFDRDNFERYMDQNGFVLESTRILPLDPFYNCLISESYRKNPIGYFIMPFLSLSSLIMGWLNIRMASSIVFIYKKAAS